jgi:hypothetical protein
MYSIAELVGRERGEQLGAHRRHPLVGTEVLVRRRRDEVGAEPVQVDRPVLREMDAVERDERTGLLRERDDVGNRGRRADGVGREGAGDELGSRTDRRREVVEIERDVVRTHVDPSDRRARILGGEDPGPHVRVVIQARDGDLIARPPRAPDRSRQVQQQRRRVLPEDDLARITAEQIGARAPRVRDQRVDLLAHPEGSVGVGGAGAHPSRHGVDRRVDHLRAPRRVDPDVLPAVRSGPSERREPRSDRRHIEGFGGRHGRSLPYLRTRRAPRGGRPSEPA